MIGNVLHKTDERVSKLERLVAKRATFGDIYTKNQNENKLTRLKTIHLENREFS
ncbi:hypothetical protein K08M4_11850 [Vibrio syngnathi]|uniref:Uncharacterized protein n=1 Tax=Vibrio syngnathi TaxID=3034029 RepID=A0AA34TN55_9VIBR|nr:hypothetical protein K08M4_11850 [Vibrio syngnathi]